MYFITRNRENEHEHWVTNSLRPFLVSMKIYCLLRINKKLAPHLSVLCISQRPLYFLASSFFSVPWSEIGLWLVIALISRKWPLKCPWNEDATRFLINSWTDANLASLTGNRRGGERKRKGKKKGKGRDLEKRGESDAVETRKLKKIRSKAWLIWC